MKNFKAFSLSLAVIISFAIYAYLLGLGHKTPNVVSTASLPVNTSVTPTTSNQPESSDSSSAPTNDATPPPAPPTPPATQKTTSGYKNGQYTGSVEDAYYGNIQVAVQISGGKLTDVTFLQYPNDRSHSIEVNTYAMPILKQEAIQAQSSNVDSVSGATDTSAAFVLSLHTALKQAL